MSNDERIGHTSVEEASRGNAEAAEEGKPIPTAAMYYFGYGRVLKPDPQGRVAVRKSKVGTRRISNTWV